jgi:hypothetical protein
VEYYVVIHLTDGPTTISGCTALHFDGFGRVKQARDYSHAKKGRHEPPVVEFTEWGGEWPEQPVELHESIALTGHPSDRCQLAGNENISRTVIERLAVDPDPDVRVNLAMNDEVPTDILLEIMRRHPELTSFVTMNASAPTFLKEPVPVMELRDLALERFLKDEHATPEETMAFMAAYDRLLDRWSRKARKTGDDSIDGTPLGELWRTIRPHE